MEGTIDLWQNFFGVSSGVAQDEKSEVIFEVLKQSLYM
jgi:hypothetical protein